MATYRFSKRAVEGPLFTIGLKARASALVLLLSLVAASMAAAPVAAQSRSSAITLVQATTVQPGPTVSTCSETCVLAPLIMPPTPAKIPGYTQLDQSTGLHVTGTMQQIDVRKYRLEVTGKVNHPLSIAYDELRCMPRTQARPTLVCPGFFADVATWTGTPLKHVIGLADPKPGASGVHLLGADNYSISLSLGDATAEGNFLAYEWEEKALPALHGFPLRAVFPRLEGNQWVKWLVKIEVY
jgi:DMSO/TMAO reductase YedYZ molybdopterin-dependent catalytic subunit